MNRTNVMIAVVLLVVIVIGVRRLIYYRHLTREYRIQQKRYQIATELTNDILFEYNVVNDVMEFSDKFEILFGRKKIMELYAKNRVALKYVYEEDHKEFVKFLQEMACGQEFVEAEVRLINAQEDYIWCQLKGKTIYSDEGEPLRIIGKIVNVDSQKRAMAKLKSRADRDALTNVLNKTVTRDKVNEIIVNGDKESLHALFVIDIDDFKGINDQYGHLMGDKVLELFVRQLKKCFRATDIIGRIGGDEFLVFMTGISNYDQVEKKAEQLKESLEELSLWGEGLPEISGSVGISIYPKDGSCYEELFVKADEALYMVKGKGKNSFLIY